MGPLGRQAGHEKDPMNGISGCIIEAQGCLLYLLCYVGYSEETFYLAKNLLLLCINKACAPNLALLSSRTVRKAGGMAQRLRALTALLDILSSSPSNHMVAHNHL